MGFPEAYSNSKLPKLGLVPCTCNPNRARTAWAALGAPTDHLAVVRSALGSRFWRFPATVSAPPHHNHPPTTPKSAALLKSAYV